MLLREREILSETDEVSSVEASVDSPVGLLLEHSKK